MKDTGDKTFKRITNNDIYDDMQHLKQDISNLKDMLGRSVKQNNDSHEITNARIVAMQAKMKLTQWIAGTSFTIMIVLLGVLLHART